MLSEIIVPKSFQQTKPNEQKLNKVRTYVDENGELDRRIVLDGKMITDNYARQLIAMEYGFEKVPCITTQEYREQKVENTPTTYIIGKFKNCEKEYIWKVTKNISIEVGDKVLVRSKCKNGKNGKNGSGVVTVVQVFTSDSASMLRHKPVIKKLRAFVSGCQK